MAPGLWRVGAVLTFPGVLRHKHLLSDPAFLPDCALDRSGSGLASQYLKVLPVPTVRPFQVLFEFGVHVRLLSALG